MVKIRKGKVTPSRTGKEYLAKLKSLLLNWGEA